MPAESQGGMSVTAAGSAGAAAPAGGSSPNGGTSGVGGGTAAVGGSGNVGTSGANSAGASGVALGALPPPWLEQDVGAVGLPGKTGYTGGVFVSQGAGHEIYHQEDQFHFTYLALSGNQTIEARIVHVENTATYATAGVMFRSGLETAAPAIMVRYAIGQGIFWAARTAQGDRWNEPGGIEGRGGDLPIWVRLARAGNDFVGSYSQDGKSWTVMETVHLGSAPQLMNVGIAVNSQLHDMTATGVLEHLTVKNGDQVTWQAMPPLSDGIDFVPSDPASPGPHCPVGGTPGAGADCARLCDCLAARCAGTSDDGQKCLSYCNAFSKTKCNNDCFAFTETRLCCSAGACTETFHDAGRCADAFEGAACP
jgi:hypothetical protein